MRAIAVRLLGVVATLLALALTAGAGVRPV